MATIVPAPCHAETAISAKIGLGKFPKFPVSRRQKAGGNELASNDGYQMVNLERRP
jgi:hypothetical protein